MKFVQLALKFPRNANYEIKDNNISHVPTKLHYRSNLEIQEEILLDLHVKESSVTGYQLHFYLEFRHFDWLELEISVYSI